MPLTIRDAVLGDAEAGTRVLRQSITDLCVADHKNDPLFLSDCLSNKTPEHFRSWIAQPGVFLLVAIEDERVVGVGAVTDDGHITFNYVSPEARFRSISKAMLGALEARTIERGCTQCTLESTKTARRFYVSNGYAEAIGTTDSCGPAPCAPISKTLDAKV